MLVIGAYGLIGSEVSRRLMAQGWQVVGLGRSAAWGRSVLPKVVWRQADLARLSQPADWRTLLAGVDAVVNASGVLQGGLGDSVEATQRDAVVALIRACEAEGPKRLVQISAVGARSDASTRFLRTKGEADAVLAESALDWTILRPGLVLSAEAYGGTSLLRALAAFPLVQPEVYGQAPIQTLPVAEVGEAVALVLERKLTGEAFDLVEERPHSLSALLAAVRRWQGLSPARARVALPGALACAAAGLADLAGWLGWRSALRSTSLQVLRDGIVGDPGPWRLRTGREIAALERTLEALPSTAQERSFARAHLVYPLLVLTLSLFWFLSALFGLVSFREAAALLDGRVSSGTAAWFVASGILADLAIAVALLFRPLVKAAAAAAILVSAGYLFGGTLLLPQLWLDPLGPLVKVLPGMALALAVWALTGRRR